MKLVIETIRRGEGLGSEYLALATAEGAKLSTSSLGFGVTAEEAAVEALKAHIAERRRVIGEAVAAQAMAQAAPIGLRLASDAEVEEERKSFRPLTKKVAISRPEIRRLLERAIAAGTWVKISGEKVNGERYTDRVVKPLSLRSDARRFLGDTPDSALICSIQGDQSRTFKLSGIERVEDV